jgi:hypothetical protein
MVVAHWVDSLDAYCWWVLREIESCGGTLITPSAGYPHFEDGFLFADVLGDDIASIVVQDHRIEYYDPVPHLLEFSFEVFDLPGGNFEYGVAKYHFFSANDAVIWRYDKHHGHSALGQWHKHVGTEAARVACNAVDLGDVLEEVRAHLNL